MMMSVHTTETALYRYVVMIFCVQVQQYLLVVYAQQRQEGGVNTNTVL
jgi:hypothetical protein